MRAYYLRARGVREISLEVIDRSLEKRRQRTWFIFPPVKKKLDDNFFLMGRQLCLTGDPGDGDKFKARDGTSRLFALPGRRAR